MPMNAEDPEDREANRFSARARRYARVGSQMGGVAARYMGSRLFGADAGGDRNAEEFARALGGLKGPLMKVAQLLATIPEAVPPEYASRFTQLQSHAPPMGPAFVRRRMAAELGPDWKERFADFTERAEASASLGQVHTARSHDGRDLACKLQYPDMQSAVEADLTQLKALFAIHGRMSPAIETGEMHKEIAIRLREELDYDLEARHMALYRIIFENDPLIRVPGVLPELSTKRLLTMTWLTGNPVLDYRQADLEARNRIAAFVFRAWWYPFSHYGVIHGDPHLGNYTVFEDGGQEAGSGSAATGTQTSPAGLNLLDYGCMRSFAPKFVQGVIDLYNGLRTDDRELMVHAYETWGFTGLSSEVIDILNIWAEFIYGPMLEDRVRALADGTSPAAYGREQAFRVHSALREKGPVTVPREFVFMDRAAVGLGGVFLHLRSELNYYRLFNDTIADFDLDTVARRQEEAFAKAGVPLPLRAGAVQTSR